MRKSVLWQSPHVRASLSALLALTAIVFVVGCGGGGGGGGNNGGNIITIPGVSGKVVESANTSSGVPGVRVTFHGSGVGDISTTTAADGTFFFANVPSTYTSFSIASPDPVKWYNYANYGGKNYDTVLCPLPLPGLSSGSNNIGTIIISSGGTNPPPPPPIAGCP